MDAEGVDFFQEYLKRHPELGARIRLAPPSVWWQGRWREILAWRLKQRSLLLEIGGRRLICLSPEDSTPVRRQRRLQQFLEELGRWRPRWRVAGVYTSTNRKDHQTAALARLVVREGPVTLAGLFCPPEDSEQRGDRLITSAVLWWDQLARSSQRPKRLVVFLPEGIWRRTSRLLVRLRLPLEVFAYPETGPSQFHRVFPGHPWSSAVDPGYCIFPYPGRAPHLLQEILIECPELELIYARDAWKLCWRGLPVVWNDRETGSCFFDYRAPTSLFSTNLADCLRHIREVERLRRYPAPDPLHPCYRLLEEGWLESLLVKNHRRLNRDFSAFVYSQVPTRLDGERKILDLLTARKDGRLAVIELKIRKDLETLPQMIEYWERVSWHLQREDFQAAGYFAGLRLSSEPPLLYLVSPLFEIHKQMPRVRQYLDCGTPIRVVGINSDWKRGLRVLRKFKM